MARPPWLPRELKLSKRFLVCVSESSSLSLPLAGPGISSPSFHRLESSLLQADMPTEPNRTSCVYARTAASADTDDRHPLIISLAARCSSRALVAAPRHPLLPGRVFICGVNVYLATHWLRLRSRIRAEAVAHAVKLTATIQLFTIISPMLLKH